MDKSAQQNVTNKYAIMKNAIAFFGVFCLVTSGAFAQQDNSVPNTGNVGLGTMNPTSRLQVNGNVKIDSCIVVEDSAFFSKDAEVGEDLKVAGSLFLPNINPIGNSDKKYMVIDPSGKVQSTSLTAIVGDIYKNNCYVIGDDPQGNPIYPSPTWQSESVAGSQIGYLFTGVNCPARVGIGTDTPTSTLDVRGNGYFLGPIGLGTQPNLAAQVLSETTREVGICIDHNWPNPFGYAFKAILNNDQTKGIGLYSNTYNKDMFTVYGDGKMELNNATGSLMRLDPDGRFVINGPNGPTFQLESNGLLRARSVKVDVNTWPDYVFEEDYELKSLEEIKAYIDANGHLPDVPSAEEVEKEGMNVADMNKILMQKLEELTLLLIQQDEKIKELEQAISH